MKKSAILVVTAFATLFAMTGYATTPANDKGCPAYMKLGDIKGEAAHSNPASQAGQRPNCPKGQLPKMENGLWQCAEMGITSPSNPQQSNTNPPPRCPKGQLPKMDKGMWKCAQPGFAAPGMPGQ